MADIQSATAELGEEKR